MNAETVASLILAYLVKGDRYQVHISYTEEVFTRNGSHEVIEFKYQGDYYQVKVYNANFIVVKRKDLPGKVCDSLASARDEVDRLLVNGTIVHEYDEYY
jgi:hypothetical protein